MRSFHSFAFRLATVTAAWFIAGATSFGEALAEPQPYDAQVIAPGAPVFSGPGETFYPTDTLAQGDTVQVYREEPGGWLGIRPPKGSFSWLFAKHAKIVGDRLAEVDKEDVPSRIGSRLSNRRNAVQVRLRQGERLEITGEQNVDGQLWYKIAPPSGEFRWIQAKNIAPLNITKAEDVSPPPVVIVPAGQDGQNLPNAITLMSGERPEADDANESSWRAAPEEAMPRAASKNISPVVTAPPQSESAAESSPANQSSAPITAIAADEAEISRQGEAPGPAAGDLAHRLTDVELQLSRLVAGPPAAWQLEPLSEEAEQLLAAASSVEDRRAVQNTRSKIDRFAAIAQRYQETATGAGPEHGHPPATSPPGHPPIAPTPDTPTPDAGHPTPDTLNYDAIGMLRPVVSKRPGAPQFALLNERGQVVAFVTPTPDVNLQPYVGHRVGITGSRGYIPEFQRAHVTAGRVAPLNERMLR